MEKDNEINVNGGSYDFGARIYDSRLGRWLSLDPLMGEYVSQSPYSFAYNSPISYIDPDGNEVILVEIPIKLTPLHRNKLTPICRFKLTP